MTLRGRKRHCRSFLAEMTCWVGAEDPQMAHRIVTVVFTIFVSIVFFMTYEVLLKKRVEGQASHGRFVHWLQTLWIQLVCTSFLFAIPGMPSPGPIAGSRT